MKLILKSFGIHKNRTFEFPDNQIVLITGESGRGKTTILRAINYALTGNGTKLPTHGEVKCCVTFEYRNMVITRTNRPRRVLLNMNGITTENDEAQSLIYQQLGRNFEIAGYIQQKGVNSFLGMTPAEKLQFLEQVVFCDIAIDDIKEKSRNKVSRLELAMSHLQGTLQGLEVVVAPDEFKYTQQQLIDMQKQYELRHQDLTKKQAELRSTIKAEETLLQTRTDLLRRISDIRIQKVPEPINIDGVEEDLRQIAAYEKYLRAQQEIKKLSDFLIPHDKQITQLTTLLSQLQVDSFTEEAELVDLTASLAEYYHQQDILHKQANFNPERYLDLSRDISELDQKLTTYVLGKEARSCPSCKASLRVCKDSLEVYTGSKYVAAEEKSMRLHLAQLRTEFYALTEAKKIAEGLPLIEEYIDLDPTEIKARIHQLQEQKTLAQTSHFKYQTLQRQLTDKQTDATIAKIRDQIQTLQQIPQVFFDRGVSQSFLEKKLQASQIQQYDIIRIQKENEVNQQKLTLLTEQLTKLPIPKEISQLSHNLTTVTHQIEQNIQDRLQCEKDLHAYTMYSQQLHRYRQYMQSRDKIQLQLQTSETQYTDAKKFREAIMTAEMLTLQSFIEEMNTHLAGFLDIFFPDNPITIILQLFKANEKTKIVRNQVNIQVSYRGVITELNSLSGGENDRVNLAFTLALAEIFNTPLILLDETLSSLDQKAAESILEHLHGINRSVLLISHQATTGQFNCLIDV